eukprot:gene2868-3668_t
MMPTKALLMERPACGPPNELCHFKAPGGRGSGAHLHHEAARNHFLCRLAALNTAMDLVREAEMESKIQFDVVVNVRPDLLFYGPSNPHCVVPWHDGFVTHDNHVQVMSRVAAELYF